MEEAKYSTTPYHQHANVEYLRYEHLAEGVVCTREAN